MASPLSSIIIPLQNDPEINTILEKHKFRINAFFELEFPNCQANIIIYPQHSKTGKHSYCVRLLLRHRLFGEGPRLEGNWPTFNTVKEALNAWIEVVKQRPEERKREWTKRAEERKRAQEARKRAGEGNDDDYDDDDDDDDVKMFL